MEDTTAQNQRNLRRLVLSIQASLGRLNLLIAICDNHRYRDQLIDTYEAELKAKGTRCDRLHLDSRQPSLKQTLQNWATEHPQQAADTPLVMTILGGDELLGLRLSDPKSAQEQFFFSLQWTRESLRAFQFPIVLWLTPAIAANLAQQAPDFWSWRGGVFEFSYPIVWDVQQQLASQDPLQPKIPNQPEVSADPADLQTQIDQLEAQDPDSPLLASLYNSLGKAYQDAGRYAEAEAPYQKALQLRQQQLGAQHPYVATSLNNLATLYHDQGRYSEAELLYQQALALRKHLFGEDSPEIAAILNNLAEVYLSQGLYDKAEPLLQEALVLRQKLLDKNPSEVAQSFNNLAALYQFKGRYREAELLYQQALQLWQRFLGKDHPDTATPLNNLAELYRLQGRYSEAEPLYKKVIKLNQQQWGSEHPNMATSLNNLALLYESQGRYGESQPLYLRAIQLDLKTVGEDHPKTAINYANLARLYTIVHRYAEAEQLYLKALQIFESRLGENHPSTLNALNGFANLLEQALEAGQAEVLSDHPRTQTLLAQIQSAPSS